MTKFLYFICLFYFADNVCYKHPILKSALCDVREETGTSAILVQTDTKPLKHVYGPAKLYLFWAKYTVICVFQHEAATPESGLKVFFENRCNIEPLIFLL